MPNFKFQSSFIRSYHLLFIYILLKVEKKSVVGPRYVFNFSQYQPNNDIMDRTEEADDLSVQSQEELKEGSITNASFRNQNLVLSS